MKLERSAGVLLHITSLPGSEGAGVLDKDAFRFADFLHESGQKYWQILPVNPVLESRAYSPYDSPSCFAGNPLFISIGRCVEKGWVYKSELPPFPVSADVRKAAFEEREPFVLESMKKIKSEFEKRASQKDKESYNKYMQDESWWLDDYCLFTALAAHYRTFAWILWPKEIAFREKNALEEHRVLLKEECELYSFIQFVFNEQWKELKTYCASKEIRLIGDLPIYVSFDSADVWANPGLFMIDPETGLRKDVAGVPPDYFSPTGQLWGNPLYRWFDDKGKLSEPVTSWWIRRIKRAFSLADMVRIDHFRAFESFWAVPFGEPTAVNGTWVKGPGIELFDCIKKELGDLPLIAEDLGVITPEVVKLRDTAGFPGMKIFQFAFDGSPDNPYLNHSITTPESVVYTGTHDNDTSAGWFASISESHRRYVREMLGICDDKDFPGRIIAAAYSTISKLCILPVQDILGLGNGSRMNVPGKMDGNWRWRLESGELTHDTVLFLKKTTHMYNRAGKTEGETNSVHLFFQNN